MATPLTNVSGIGPQTAKILKENGYESAEDIASASKEQLAKVPGFGHSRSKNVISEAKKVVPASAGQAIVEKLDKISGKAEKKVKEIKKKAKKITKKLKDKKKKDSEKKKSKKDKSKKSKKKTGKAQKKK